MTKSSISCGEVLDISMVSSLFADLKEAIQGENSIELSAKDLQRIDGAGIQLLVAFFAEARKLSLDVNWADTSACLNDAAKILGVTEQLSLN